MELKIILSDISTENLLSLRRDIDLLLKTRNPIGHKLVDLDLSVRAVNVLNGAGISFIEDLSEYTESDFVRFRNMGKKSVCEIKELMSKYNVSFIQTKI